MAVPVTVIEPAVWLMIPPVAVTFRFGDEIELFKETVLPVRLIVPVLFAESGAETVMLFEDVIRLRSAPLMNDVELATVMVPSDPFEKLTVRLFAKPLAPES